MAEGQLVWCMVLRITGLRGWGGRMEAHMDHFWLLMRSHAQVETRVHSGEWGVVHVMGVDDNKDARSGISGGSKGCKGKGMGRAARPRGPAPLPPVYAPLPAAPPATQVAGWLQQQRPQPQW